VFILNIGEGDTWSFYLNRRRMVPIAEKNYFVLIMLDTKPLCGFKYARTPRYLEILLIGRIEFGNNF